MPLCDPLVTLARSVTGNPGPADAARCAFSHFSGGNVKRPRAPLSNISRRHRTRSRRGVPPRDGSSRHALFVFFAVFGPRLFERTLRRPTDLRCQYRAHLAGAAGSRRRWIVHICKRSGRARSGATARSRHGPISPGPAARPAASSSAACIVPAQHSLPVNVAAFTLCARRCRFHQPSNRVR